MKIEDKKIILNLNKQIDKLHQSVKGLAVITDETLDTTVELTKHIISLQEDFITVINRLNEVELSIEATPSLKNFLYRQLRILMKELIHLILKRPDDIEGHQKYNEW
jgi:hypothetical protein